MNNNDELLHVIYDYTSKGDDELTLKRGSILEVLSKDKEISGSEGWWAGRLIDSESVGIFPANFVASVVPNLPTIDYNDLQIKDLIGVGGFGHVHYGKFGEVDVAIKTAKSLTSFNAIKRSPSYKTHSDDQSSTVHKNVIDGLLREARVFSNLKHSNIIQLFGVSSSIETNNLYLVMEYARGGALNQLLEKRQSGLYPNVFIHYAKQIADGIKYLHDESLGHIIHRDLKCSNILIFEDIENIHDDSELLDKTLKITDFGLAEKQLQTSGVLTAGTYAWMSPECIRTNEFSTKSDAWSFGVLLWECLTGEIPYKGFDQPQVAYGIATNQYSLPIPSTCPEEFSQLMKDCWQINPEDRPTFSELYDQINTIIEEKYANNQLYNMETNEESYSSLQQDWRKEIQDIFEEFKEKEKEIHDREQAMFQLDLAQKHQRMQLEQWERELHDREMSVIERELSLLMLANNQERLHQQTPKIQKRSGRFMRSLLHATLNGNGHFSSTAATDLISSPKDFRHIISICRDHNTHRHHHEYASSSPIPNSLSSTTCSSTNSHRKYTSTSTPTTPNLNRLRTLTSSGDLTINRIFDEEYLINNDVHPHDLNHPPISPDKPSRCLPINQTKSSSTIKQHSRWRKPKTWSASSATKRKHGKTTNIRPGDSKWYLETTSTTNTNDDTTTISSTKSAPVIIGSNQKLGYSSSPSTCSTPNDRSLARAVFDINSMLASIGLGRRLPTQSSLSTASSSSSLISTPTTTIRNPLHETIFRSTSETKSKPISTSSSSTNTSPSPLTKKEHKRTCSTPITNIQTQTNTSRARPNYSSTRPNSLALSFIPRSSRPINTSHSDSQLVDKHYNRSTKITSTPEEDEQTINDDGDDRFYSAQSSKTTTPMVQSFGMPIKTSNSQPQLNHPCLLDIDTEEQVEHKTKVLPPSVDKKKLFHSSDTLERDFLH
ncbi:unnamed protein product [Adineta steineri]|uniref:mitogen-activated protein kinase kinase kinase n=1 Tax=Adineta steineri TaxID=433720 RepID=A0A815LEG2_9BILA|nr:unnamed protein product [Adineta steineri]CAF1408873.1 unnamed protein product [Adineta steineri]